MPRFLQILVLICGLQLLLPPGWCCMLRAAPRSSSNSAATKKTCCGCKKCSREKTPSAPEPVTPTTDPCPCTDRSATTPVVQKDTPVLVAAAVAPMVADSVLPAAELFTTLNGPVTMHSTSLQILNCTWRC